MAPVAGLLLRLDPHLQNLAVVLPEQEQYIHVLRQGTEAFQLAQAETDTYSGKMKQLSNVIGDVRERTGAALSPVILRLTESLRNSIPAIESWVQWFRERL